jgi:hypothetical protein
MQTTIDQASNAIRQQVFSGTAEEIMAAMNADIRETETVLQRRELSEAEFRGYNRHERRKAAALARRTRS